MREFIVAEVSMSWPQVNPNAVVKSRPPGYVMPEMLGERFEDVIAINSDRGYELFNWQLTSVVRQMPPGYQTDTKDLLIETIIAVFRKRTS